MRKTRAFTLLELLVVVAIIGVLAALSYPVFTSVQKSGNKTREISAGRQLAAAYAAAAADNDGTLMIGYATSAEAWDDLGRPVANPVCNRYPWRLAKYLGYKVVGSLLVNDQAKIADLRAQQESYNYLVSLAPTFGMNSMLVGGDYHGVMAPTAMTLKRFGKFCVTRLSEPQAPSRLILFASAHYLTADANYYGYHTIEPPNLTGQNWAGQYDESNAKSLGYVHLRYDKQAVVVMLDGHVELLDEAELRDMRRWSNQAAEADDAAYFLGKG
jgi:prepilin-type N-terminal cleavage/methylation domain-containing protein